MPRGRERYLRDRAERRSRRTYDRYPMDYRDYNREYSSMDYARQSRYSREPERYSMEHKQRNCRYILVCKIIYDIIKLWIGEAT